MNLGVQAAKVIARIVEKSSTICKVVIPRNQIGDEGAKILANMLIKSRQIVALDVSSNEITTQGGNAIIHALTYNQSLIDLNLSSTEGLNRNTLGAKGVAPLQSVLAFNNYLTILNVSGNFIGNKGLRYICAGLNQGPN